MLSATKAPRQCGMHDSAVLGEIDRWVAVSRFFSSRVQL
jgi:hypothetical protein